MSDTLTQQDIMRFLLSGAWQDHLDERTLRQGHYKYAKRDYANLIVESLDTGDIEVKIQVDNHALVIAFWEEEEGIMWESQCACRGGSGCEHVVAAFFWWKKKKKLASSTPPLSKREKPEALLSFSPKEASSSPRISSGRPVFWIKKGKQAPYGELFFKENDSLKPLLLNTLHKTALHIEVTNALYALELHPDKSMPPRWAPLPREWQAPIYWQRFIHELAPQLRQKGWEIQWEAHAIEPPLIFSSKDWHAEWVEEGRGWFSLSAGFQIQGEYFEIQPILTTLLAYDFLERSKNQASDATFLLFLPDGRPLVLPIGRFRRILTQLANLLDSLRDGFPLRVHFVQKKAIEEIDKDLTFCEEIAQKEGSIGGKKDLSELFDNTEQKNTLQKEFVHLKKLKASLRDYQQEGCAWMAWLSLHHLHGVLADDMGLGKTLQTIAFILWRREKLQTKKPSLVIAPTSVISAWQKECARFAPHLQLTVLQGPKRHECFKKIATSDIVLSSYALLSRDLELLSQHAYDLLVLDEAQHIKNHDTQAAQSVRAFDATMRLALSGTPIENRLTEFWSLFDFLIPGLLGSREQFESFFGKPIEKEPHGQRAAALKNQIAPLILRRTKDQVAKELPPKTIIEHRISLQGEEADLYEAIRSTMDKKVRQILAQKGQEAQMVFLEALLKLRQLCCHPQLLSPSMSPPQHGAKFDYLKELLETLLGEGRRLLIFSQFTSMLARIETYLREKSISYLLLTGHSKNRAELVNAFQNLEASVFLISLKAGGTGLTLTAADTVIHYDPWWNPAVENQATDRAYRIGQDKPVFVHKLIIENSVEERIARMQSSKATLSESIIDKKNTEKLLDTLLAP